MHRGFNTFGLNLTLTAAGAFVLAVTTAATGGFVQQRLIVMEPGPLDSSAPVPYFIANGLGVPGWEPADQELARIAFDAWSRESRDRLRFVEVASESEALVRLVWVSAEQGLFGETRHIRIDGRPGAFVYVMPDASQLGPALAGRANDDKLLRDTIVYLTCVHELGHAVGMGHTDQFADIMYSFTYGGNLTDYFLRYRAGLASRADIRSYSGLSTADVTTLRSLYSGD